MSGDREPFARYLARMEAQGFHPSRKLGQNFLLDPSLHRVIAHTAGLRDTDLALEIGGGLGFLSRELATLAGRLVVVEIDPRLHAILKVDFARLDPTSERIELVLADALGPDDRLAPEVLAALARRAPASGGAFVVVANLPYAVSGPLLARLPLLEPAPDRIVVVVQLELAQRLAAAPGSAEFGSLSATLGAGYRMRIERKIGREVFRPRPNVDSALVVFERRADGPLWSLPARARIEFAAFVRSLFSSRRKTLAAGIPLARARRGLPEAEITLAPELARARPQDLDPASWVRLFTECGGRF